MNGRVSVSGGKLAWASAVICMEPALRCEKVILLSLFEGDSMFKIAVRITNPLKEDQCAVIRVFIEIGLQSCWDLSGFWVWKKVLTKDNCYGLAGNIQDDREETTDVVRHWSGTQSCYQEAYCGYWVWDHVEPYTKHSWLGNCSALNSELEVKLTPDHILMCLFMGGTRQTTKT